MTTEETGQYTCEAVNEAGSDSDDIHITVRGKETITRVGQQ